MQRNGAQKQLIKDLFSFRVVFAYGGWFADFDYWLLKPLPLTPENIFSSEPCKSDGGWSKTNLEIARPKYARGHINLGLFKMKKGHDAAGNIARKMHEHMTRVGKKTFASTRHWMWNTKLVRETVQSQTTLLAAVAGPCFFSPLPHWLRCYDGRSRMSCGYGVPSLAQIQEVSFAVNLWCRQWPRSLTKSVTKALSDVPFIASKYPIAHYLKVACKKCHRKKQVSRIGPFRWYCAACEITWVLAACAVGTESATQASAAKARDKMDRPKCRKCKSRDHVHSHGERWRCLSCKKTWYK